MTQIRIYKNGIECYRSNSETLVQSFLKNEKHLREQQIKNLMVMDKLYRTVKRDRHFNQHTCQYDNKTYIFQGNRQRILNNLGKDVYEIYTYEPITTKTKTNAKKRNSQTKLF